MSLYKAAYEDWQRGEVSTALSKLEQVLELDRDWPDAVTPEFGPGYQDLYNQVRSAQEAIKGAYEAARRQLGEENFEAASRICDEYRKKYPQHPLFLGLQFEIEERKGQALSAYIARIEKEVEQEPDLNRRVAILQEAFARHPVERFDHSLTTTRAKRDLVDAIVTKARNLEDSGQLAEAIGQWEILRTIHGRYPGLNLEVERLIKRREQQAVKERKARLAEEIDRYLGSGDYSKAMELVRDALLQYPNEGEFASLEQLARKGQEEAAEAQRLLAEARGLLSEERVAEGIETLRRARELDRRDPAIRVLLVDTLLTEARRQIDVDWRKAAALVQQAADIDPVIPLLKGLRGELAEKERAEFVEGCIRDARRAQAEGDLTTALDMVSRGLASYPQEGRLIQLRSTLEKALQEKRRQTRERDLEEARTIASKLENTTVLHDRAALDTRLKEIKNNYLDDGDFTSITVLMRPQPAPGPTPPEPHPSAVARMDRRTDALKVLGTRFKAVVKNGWIKMVGFLALAKRPEHRKQLFIGTVVLAVCVAVVIKVLWPKPPTKPEVQRVPVLLAVEPPEANLRIDGSPVNASRPVELTPGKHTVEATLEGYETYRQEFHVPPQKLPIVLTPLPPVLRVVTDLRSGQVWLDGARKADLAEDGQFVLDNPPTGDHTLKVVSEKVNAVIPFTVSPGAAPAASAEAAASELKMVVVSSYRGRAMVGSYLGTAALEVDGSPRGDAGPGGIEVTGFAPGTHNLIFRGRAIGEHQVTVDVGSNPTLLVSLASDRNVGTIVVNANEADYRIFVDERPQRVRQQKEGKGTIHNVEAGLHTVRIEKEEFRIEPESLQVDVRKGRLATAEFKLTPLQQAATLVIEGAPPSMIVTFGGREFPVPRDGRIVIQDVTHGEHAIQLRQVGYRPRTLHRTFEKRKTVRLDGKDLNLEVAYATIHFTQLSPATMRMTIQQKQFDAIRYTGSTTVTGPQQILVPFGDYSVTGSAEGYHDETKTFNIHDEVRIPVVFELKRQEPEKVERKDPPKPVGMEGWERPWALDSGWYARRGGGVALFAAQTGPGTFRFTVNRPAGGILRIGKGNPIEWVCNWLDQSNYVVFRFTDDALETWQASGSPERRVSQHRHRLGDKTEYTVEVYVRPDLIRSLITDKGVEKLSASHFGQNLGKGRFGFRTNEGAVLKIKDFLFTPTQ